MEEAEWATEMGVKTGLPVVTTLCIGPEGDMHGISAGECAVRLAKAGSEIEFLNIFIIYRFKFLNVKSSENALNTI